MTQADNLAALGSNVNTSGVLQIESGGTGATSNTAARTNLGLGTIATQNANNVSITGGSISGLSSSISVASGGTGQTSLTANNVILGNGANSVAFVAPGSNGNLLTSNGTTWVSSAPAPSGGIGTGQTWQNVTGSRSSGVTYTNSTGKPIQVFVTKSTNGSGGTFVDGNQVGYWFANGNDFIVFACVIPNGSTYRVDGGIGQWSELR